MKVARTIGATALLGLLAFSWGFLSHRHQVFPYPLLWRFAGQGTENYPLLSGNPAPDLSRLQGLAYVDSQFDPNYEISGVLRHDQALSSPGFNFYGPRTHARAQLLRMDGSIVHEWKGLPTEQWHHIELLEDGGILANIKDSRLIRLSADSDEIWSFDSRFHHSLSVYDGRIWALDRAPIRAPDLHEEQLILADYITVLDLAGTFLERISLLESLRESPYSYLLPSISTESYNTNEPLDILHANHVEIFDGSLVHHSALFAAGNILVSLRNINSIAILDAETRNAIWLWGPSNLTYQHHPTLLDTGRILIFDNGTEESRVVELDPETYRIHWQYRDDSFFSKTRGSNQRLPNGNTLITEGDTGYVFEVTPEGAIVWEFANPFVDADGNRAAIWRMTRVESSLINFETH